MEEFRYDTYCGLYCGACEIMDAYRAGIESGRTPQWDDLPASFTGHIPHAEIKCHGCKSDDVFAGCRTCPIRACALKKGILGTCRDCRKYPCMIYAAFKVVWWLRKLGKKLPHWRAAKPNLKRMREIGIDRWLEEQDKAWRCPGCGTKFTWYRTACAGCGKDVEPLKDYNRI
jgi:hypothetical protein